MPKKILDTPSAPAAIGPYNVAVEAGGLVFLSGQVALLPEGGRAEDDIEVQAKQVLENIGAILGDLGLSFPDVVKTTIFLADIDDYPLVNDIYAQYMGAEAPARSAVQAGALPGGFLVEIEVVASRS
jgi:2-iminobutanoate/2-iminopropanoate deaminase